VYSKYIELQDFVNRKVSSDGFVIYRSTDCVDAICDIAGKDSIAAAIKGLQKHKLTVLLPVVVRIPTEYGDYQLENNVRILRKRLKQIAPNAKVLSTLYVKADEIWGLLNGRFVSKIIQLFGFYSPCLGCHLFIHSVRALLAHLLRVPCVISGERELHGTRVKINQLPCALNSYVYLMSQLNIEHILPLRKIADDSEIYKILGSSSVVIGQKKCTFAKNYYSIDYDVVVRTELIDKYYKSFALPFMGEVLKSLISGEYNSENLETYAAWLLEKHETDG